MPDTAPEPTVLIVEDEMFIRLNSADALTDAGFVVLEAENAEEALALLECRDDVQVLFTDVQMPGAIDGLQLAEHVHERWPKVRLLVTSGRIRPRTEDLPDDGKFLPKPYRVDRLVETINAVLKQ